MNQNYQSQEKKKKPLTRNQTAMLTIMISAAVSFFLGFVFALIPVGEDTTFSSKLLDCAEMMYICFGAGTSISGILMFITSIEEDYCFYIGNVYYYGTALLTAFLSKFVYGKTINLVIISFVIVVMACYIFLLKKKISDLEIHQA